MVTPVDDLVRRFVVPVMKEAGFERKGRLFRLNNEAGDYVMVSVGVRDGGGEFCIVPMVAPQPLLQWRSSLSGRPDMLLKEPTNGLLLRCLVPPPHLWAGNRGAFSGETPLESWGPENYPHWAFSTPQEMEECGRLVATGIQDQVLPVLVPLLDRPALFRAMEDPKLWTLVPSPQHQVLLVVETAPVGEVEALLERAAQIQQHEALESWIRSRLAARSAT